MQFAFILFLLVYFVSISLILFNIGKISLFFFIRLIAVLPFALDTLSFYIYLWKLIYGTFSCYPSIYFGDFNGGLHWCLIMHLKYKIRTVDDTTVSLEDLNGDVAVDELLHLFYYELLNASRIWVL